MASYPPEEGVSTPSTEVSVGQALAGLIRMMEAQTRAMEALQLELKELKSQRAASGDSERGGALHGHDSMDSRGERARPQPPPAQGTSSAGVSLGFDLGGVDEVQVFPRELKLKDLPRLGREKGELPYSKWRIDARAMIRAAQASMVIDRAPSPDFPTDVKRWYRVCDGVVYAALLLAVRDVPILADQVRRVEGRDDSAHQTWGLIKAHYIRLAANNRTFLTRKLHELEPRDGESMESFLNRCFVLQDDFASYGLTLGDHELITQVFSKLSFHWRQTCGFGDKAEDELNWGEVATALQDQDNKRRHSNTKAPDALLPLGWTRKGKSDGQAKRASSPPKGRSRSPQRGERKEPRGGEKETPRPPLIVCYACFEVGHGCNKCPKKPDGWKLTPEAKEKAARILAREKQSHRDRTAARAAKGSQEKGETSSLGRSSSGSSRASSDGYCSGDL